MIPAVRELGAPSTLLAGIAAPRMDRLPGSRRGASRWRILDAKLELDRDGVVLYSCGGRTVLGVIHSPEPGPRNDRSPSAPGMRLYEFPEDPALPGLASALDGEAMGRILEGALPGERVVRCRVHPLRYRPLRRCTLQVDAWTRSSSAGMRRRTLFAKLYHDHAKALAAFERMACLARSEDLIDAGVGVARPVAFVPELAMVVQESLAGSPLESMLTGTGENAAARRLGQAARALAALHEHAPIVGRPRLMASYVERMGRRGGLVREIDTDLGARMVHLARVSRAMLDELAGGGPPVRVVHGDCKPSQFLIDGDLTAILDFDHSGLADPAVDVGDFLAALRRAAVSARWRRAGSRADADTSEAVFLDEYASAAGRTGELERRARSYEAIALQRKAYRAFLRSRRSPLPHALLDEAERVLAELAGCSEAEL